MSRNLSHITCVLLTEMLIPLLLQGCGPRYPAVDEPSSKAIALRGFAGPEIGNVRELPDSVKPDALALVNAYNSRNFGSPGWRRVLLELVTDGYVTRTLTVVNLWRRKGGEVRTLFLLEEPQGLSGTSYLLIEREGESKMPDMRVHLFLPAGQRQVLEITPNNFNEGLLGSDFTYTDLRKQLPTHGCRYRVVGESTLLNESTWVVEAEPLSQPTLQTFSWALARFYLAKNFRFLLGADYHTSLQDEKGVPHSIKRMRVESLERINGVWTATRITMFGAHNQLSVLTLKDARFDVANIDSRIFSREKLPLLAERVGQGWSPGDSTGSRQ